MILKLKRTPGIYLVGFMGCGKTTVGRALAERLGWKFIDADSVIEAEQKAEIAQIFSSRGEEEFRRIESDLIERYVRRVERGNATVMALGGGAYVQQRNYELLRDNGITVWLDCPFEIAGRRVGEGSERPLARDPEKFEALYHARKPYYARADFRILNDSDDPAAAVDAILELPIF